MSLEPSEAMVLAENQGKIFTNKLKPFLVDHLLVSSTDRKLKSIQKKTNKEIVFLLLSYLALVEKGTTPATKFSTPGSGPNRH